MKKQIGYYLSGVIGLAETAVICVYLNRIYSMPIECIIIIMAIGAGFLMFGVNLISTFRKIEEQLPAADRANLRRTAFYQLHELFLLQSLAAVLLFLHFHTPQWIALPLVKEVLLGAIFLDLKKN